MSLWRTVIGIDPGRKGALASIGILSGMVKVHPMPEEEDRGMCLHDLRLILQEYTPSTTLVGIEWNTGMPHEVPDYAFRFGLQTGQLDAYAHAMGFSVRHVSSSKWTGYFGLAGKQDQTALPVRVALLEKAYPAFSRLLRGPRGGILDGNVDALLIAHYFRLGETTFGHRGGRRPAIQRG